MPCSIGMGIVHVGFTNWEHIALITSFDIILCCSIRELRLRSHNTIFNIKNKTANYMSWCTASCVLGVLPIQHTKRITDQELQIIPPVFSFLVLEAKAFRWPELENDRKYVFINSHRSVRQCSLSDLKDQIESYIN